jgi:hypothetical protein
MVLMECRLLLSRVYMFFLDKYRFRWVVCQLDTIRKEKEKMAAEKRNKKDWHPRLTEISSGTRLRNLYKGIKGKFAVEEIWMGGGGNANIQCIAIC